MSVTSVSLPQPVIHPPQLSSPHNSFPVPSHQSSFSFYLYPHSFNSPSVSSHTCRFYITSFSIPSTILLSLSYPCPSFIPSSLHITISLPFTLQSRSPPSTRPVAINLINTTDWSNKKYRRHSLRYCNTFSLWGREKGIKERYISLLIPDKSLLSSTPSRETKGTVLGGSGGITINQTKMGVMKKKKKNRRLSDTSAAPFAWIQGHVHHHHHYHCCPSLTPNHLHHCHNHHSCLTPPLPWDPLSTTTSITATIPPPHHHLLSPSPLPLPPPPHPPQ